MKLRQTLLGSVLLTGAYATVAHAACSGSSPPTVASSVGYCLNTFASGSFSTSNVDMGKTYKQGFQWYPFNFYGLSPVTTHITFNGDKSITVGQGGNGFNANLASAGHTGGWPGYFVGTAFGGGAYIQAVIKFNAHAYNGIGIGWPAFWGGALEQEIGTAQWPGQAANYLHYIETDIFEYFQGQWNASLNAYQATTIDWYGTGGTNYSTYADPTVPQADFSNYNTVAMLWVPATSTTKGYINYYWNGTLVKSVGYTQLTNSDAPPPSASKPWTFGIIDQDHLVIEMGSDNVYPLTVQSVDVWQKSTTSNMTTPSPADTLVQGSNGAVTDSKGGVWTINSSNYLVWNGVVQDTAWTYNQIFWNGTNLYVYCTTHGHTTWVLVNLVTGAGTVVSGTPAGA